MAGPTFDIAGWRCASGDPGLQQALGNAHLARIRPRCLCTPEGVETCVAIAGDGFAIKRMPYTARKHRTGCGFADSAEVPGNWSLRRRVVADRPGFDTFKKRSFALGCMLSDLWRAAELTHWTPAFEGKRAWSTVRRHLLAASSGIRWSGAPLDEQLYVPETFKSDQSAAIVERRAARCAQIMVRETATGIFVVIAEVKRIKPKDRGYALILKHVPDVGFGLSDSRYLWINRLFANEISLTGTEHSLHLVGAVVVTLTPQHQPDVIDLALVAMTPEWLPVRNAVERGEVARLVSERKPFVVDEALGRRQTWRHWRVPAQAFVRSHGSRMIRMSALRGMRTRARVACVALASLDATCPSSPALAWGSEGHEVVAVVAQSLLTTKARQRIDAILAVEPGATLESISNWADQTRSPATAPWHYVNLPRDANCVYSPPLDCPTGNCIVAALRTQASRLSHPASPSAQLEALKYVVHFVGDLHQPLHAGFADDRGGNTYQLQAFGRGTNLHAVWDAALVSHVESRAPAFANVVRHQPRPEISDAFVPEDWATESCRIASQPDFYPGRRLEQAYLDAYEPVAKMRLLLAALRLASLLNATFGD